MHDVSFSCLWAYYAVGIALVFAFKDNRAFCKYICPITIFLKPMSYFSVFRITCNKDKCISCGKCKQVCPMNVDVTDNSRKRKKMEQNVFYVWNVLEIAQRMHFRLHSLMVCGVFFFVMGGRFFLDFG